MDTGAINTPPLADPSHHSLPIGETMKEAWEYVHGFKGPFWMAFIIIMLISIGILMFKTLLLTSLPVASSQVNSLSGSSTTEISNMAMMLLDIISLLLSMGLMYIGLRRVANLTISTGMVFKGFSPLFIFKLLGVEIIKMLLICIFLFVPFFINIVMPPINYGIFIAVIDLVCFLVAYFILIRLSLAELVVFDKGLGPIDAIKLSFQATKGFVWRIFWLGLITVLIIIVSIIPLGVGLIWSLPFMMLIYPVIYKRLIGVSIT